MARLPRYLFLSDIDHIIIRGIGHMDLFFSDADHRIFLEKLNRFKLIDNVEIHAYCLMDNHVHLLIKASTDLIPLFLKRLEVSYASYFNGTKEHVGHLFQNRYKSEPVTDSSYYLSVLRYILRNPEAAGMCRWNRYRYSSAQTYLGEKDDGLTDTSMALDMLGSRVEFIRFMQKNDDAAEGSILEADSKARHKILTDTEASDIIRKICRTSDTLEITTMDNAARNDVLSRLKKEGLSVRQIERLTGVSRSVVQRAN